MFGHFCCDIRPAIDCSICVCAFALDEQRAPLDARIQGDARGSLFFTWTKDVYSSSWPKTAYLVSPPVSLLWEMKEISSGCQSLPFLLTTGNGAGRLNSWPMIAHCWAPCILWHFGPMCGVRCLVSSTATICRCRIFPQISSKLPLLPWWNFHSCP